MRLFLRRSTVGQEPLAVAMTGVRMGERLLQLGVDDPVVAGILASKPGLSGESAVVVANEEAGALARKAVAESGAAANVSVHPLNSLPFAPASFDVIVIHNRGGLLNGPGTDAAAGLQECLRVLRSGGRLIVLEQGTPAGLGALLKGRAAGSASALPLLERAGLRAVRVLGDRDNYRFLEGLRP
jgi:SAM-dependent methyltransferase